MLTGPAPAVAHRAPDPQRKAVLVVSLENFDVRYASPLAVEWLGLPADRLLGRSIMLSLPPLGQALTRAVSNGLSPTSTSLGIAMATSEGAPLRVTAHRAEMDAIIDFLVVDNHTAAVEKPPVTQHDGNHIPDDLALQRRLDEMMRDLAALRARIPCTKAMLRGEDPMLFWVWQAEGALAQVSQRFACLCATQRKSTDVFCRPPADALHAQGENVR